MSKHRDEKTPPKPRGGSTNRVNAKLVLALLAAQDQPRSWVELTKLLNVTTAPDIKRARQVVQGLVRQREVTVDEQRLYAIVPKVAAKQARRAAKDNRASTKQLLQPAAKQQRSSAQGTDVGVITGGGGRYAVDGHTLEKASRNTLSVRAGDRVSYVVDNDFARVCDVLEQSTLPALGVLNLRGRSPQVDPVGRSFDGRIQLLHRPSKAVHGDTVRVQITDQNEQGLLGEVIAVVNSDSVLEQAIDTTLESLEIPKEWPEVATRAVKRLPKSVQAQQHQDRQDITDLPLVTIDGETAKDFDDAVYAKALGGRKGWRLVVAIADVAHYVKPGAVLDVEAEKRSTSVYLPSFVVPMLPEALSNELCSLKPNVHRLALVCDMQVSVKGLVREFKFYNGLIRSHGRLTYNQVQAHLDNGEALPCKKADSTQVEASVAALHNVFKAFSEAKDVRGGLDFDSREGVIEIVDGHVSGVSAVARLTAHRIIEEAMINANVCAAVLLEDAASRSLYRVHDKPDALKLDDLRQDLMSIGLSIPDSVPSSKTYQSLLREIADKDQGWLYQQLVLRSMKQAVYTPENAGHFGLGLERYMHFTSPIRRYPDLLVHRAIKSVLAGQSTRARWVPSAEQLINLGEQCSSKERRAESAGWAVESWLKCDLLRHRVGDVVKGQIATVTEFGLFIEIEDYFVQGLLHISDLGSDYFRYEPRRQCLVGERNGLRFTLGDPIEVLIANVEPAQGKIELQLGHRGGKARSQGSQKKGHAHKRSKSASGSGGQARAKKGKKNSKGGGSK